MKSARAELSAVASWASQLTDAERERARKGLSLRQFTSGSYICHRGEVLEPWTGVVSGLVKLSAISEQGKAMTFAGVGAGGWFGEGTVLKNEPRRYDVVALRDTELAMLSRPVFMWLFENSVGFNRFLVHQLNERLGQFIAAVELDRIHDSTARIARHIALLFNPVLYPDLGDHIELSQEELALLAGVSRPTASRALQQLETAGLVRIERGGVTVLDLAQLGRFRG